MCSLDKTVSVDMSYVVNFSQIFIGRKMIVYHERFVECGKISQLKIDGEYLIISLSEINRSERSSGKLLSSGGNSNWLFPLKNWFGVFVGGNFYMGPPQLDNHYFQYAVILPENVFSL